MSRIIATTILITLSCFMISAQQIDKQSLKPTAPVEPRAPSSTEPPFNTSLRLSELRQAFGQSQTKTSLVVPDKAANEIGNFVVIIGSVYMHLPWDRSLLPISGGGASGCFSVDLPQRISRLRSEVTGLESLNQRGPQVVPR